MDRSEQERTRQYLRSSGKPFMIVDSEDNSDEYANFRFIGSYENREVLFDAALYTLRLQHNSEVYQMALEITSGKFPDYVRDLEDDQGEESRIADENREEASSFMDDIIAELEEEEVVKVQEHIEMEEEDQECISLNAGLNVEMISPQVINDFVNAFRNDRLRLDPGLYSFQYDEDQ